MNQIEDSVYISNQPQSSFSDRSLQFGEGLFETFRLNAQGEIPLWALHQARLKEGLKRLGFNPNSLDAAEQFLFVNLPRDKAFNAGKLLVTRDAKVRGYAGLLENKPNLLLNFFSAPLNEDKGLSLGVSDIRLGLQPALAGIKHCNRLEQVLAQTQLKPEHDDALLLTSDGHVIESCSSNLFVYIDNQWLTPKLDNTGVRGVARQWLMSKMPVIEARLTLEDMYNAQHVYISNALKGFRYVKCLLTQQRHEYSSCKRMQAYQAEFKSLFV